MTKQDKLKWTGGIAGLLMAATALVSEIRSWRREEALWEYSRSIHVAHDTGKWVAETLPEDWRKKP